MFHKVELQTFAFSIDIHSKCYILRCCFNNFEIHIFTGQQNLLHLIYLPHKTKLNQHGCKKEKPFGDEI